MADQMLAHYPAILRMLSGRAQESGPDIDKDGLLVTAAGQQTSPTRKYHAAAHNKFTNKIASLPCALKGALHMELAVI